MTMTYSMTPQGTASAASHPEKSKPHGGHAAGRQDAESFLEPLLGCFPLVRRAEVLTLCGVLTVDLAATLIAGQGPMQVAGFAGAAIGAGFVLAAVCVMVSIQVRYTFEHAGMWRRHFYELKLARFDEACAQLKSLSVGEAVGAVRTVQALRRETGLLDRRLAIEGIILTRRLRDLYWIGRAAAVLGAVTAGAILAALKSAATPALFLAAGALLAALMTYILVEVWIRDRMVHVFALLAPSPKETSQAFDPSPHLEAAVERLLERLNRHFDRLKGVRDSFEEENEPSG